MLAICLKLLSILGILLLILLGLFLAILLLVLFYPVTYRIRGKKDEKELALSVKIKWLSGLIRVHYQYPQPGRVKLKILCFTLYDVQIPPDKSNNGKKQEKTKKSASDVSDSDKFNARSGEETGNESEVRSPVVSEGVKNPDLKGDSGSNESVHEISRDKGTGENADSQKISQEAETGESIVTDVSSSGFKEERDEKNGKFSDKIRKTKYTIQGIYDKIKKIWENISYYIELLREEDTKELFAHAFKVFYKILKSIRPRHVKADILFGTGSPDTTGYIYGVYCIMTTSMKPGFLITPDFERKIFQGEFYVAGHVGIGVLFANGLRLLLDKKLHIFIRKIRKKTKTK